MCGNDSYGKEAETQYLRRRRIGIRFIILLWVLSVIIAPVQAASVRELIEQGNSALSNGQYDKALEAYDKASVERPESPEIYYNKGNVFYRQEDYDKAKEMFETAALKTKDLQLEARCDYNLGNTLFCQGQRQKDSDLQKALAAYQTAIKHYQDALKRDPALKDAAHNIEIARLIMKDILDKLKKQAEDQKKQQEQQKQIQEQLKQLIERQEQAVKQNKSLSEKKAKEGQTPETQKQTQQLAEEQKNIKDQTRDVSEKLSQQPQPSQPPNQAQTKPSPQDEARKHLEQSVTEQATAEQHLRKEQLEAAQPDQQKALDHMQKALEALAGETEPSPAPSNQDQDQNQKQPPQPRPQPRDKNARDIINEEKENKQNRQTQVPGQYHPVDKDW